MPISATGTSTDARRKPASAAGRDGGFSLLELLVVVTIIGLFAGAAMLSIGIAGDDRDVERAATRLRGVLDLVREEAIMQSREHAILFGEEGYRFYVYDPLQERWVLPADDALLAPRELEGTIALDLRVEDRDLVLDPLPDEDPGMRAREAEEAPQPQVMIMSTGEVTPFEVDLYRDRAGPRITVTAGIDGSTRIEKESADGA